MKITGSVAMSLHLLVFYLFYLSICLASTPPSTPTNNTHLKGTPTNQANPGNEATKRNINKRTERVPNSRWPQDQEQDQVFTKLSLSLWLNWRERNDLNKLEELRRGDYYPPPRPRNASTPLSLRNVGVEERERERKAEFEIVVTDSASKSSSSCSSLTCKWFTSWEFIMVTTVMLTWLLTLTSLLCLARTTFGREILESFSSCCTREKDTGNEVLAKGLGYFDGSPGMRRLVLIEDEEEDEEDEDDKEEEEDVSSVSSSSQKEIPGTSRTWKPPRKGTYILQEPTTKDYLLELGSYRLHKDADEEVEKDNVKYVLEGATYILQSERINRENSSEDMDLYALIDDYDRIEGIEGLYGIIKQGRGDIGGGGGGYRRGDRINRRLSYDERINEGRRRESYDVNGTGISRRDDNKEGRKERKPTQIVEIEEEKIENETKEMKRGERKANDLFLSPNNLDVNKGEKIALKKTVSEGRPKGGAVGGGARPRADTYYHTKRAASFPMDNYCPTYLLPRKLSLIQEEEMH